MRITAAFAIAGLAVFLDGCAGHLVFGRADATGVPDSAVPFYAPMPAMIINISGDCTVSTTYTSIADPGNLRWVKPKTGYGSSNLSANFANGLMTSFGQTSDNKVPETITAVGSLATAAAGLVKSAALPAAATDTTPKKVCTAQSKIFVIKDKSWVLQPDMHAEAEPH